MKPILVQIPGVNKGDMWKLVGYWDGDLCVTGDWKYTFVYDGMEWVHTIPFGADWFDGASVPWGIRPIIKMGGRYMPDEAWVPHDDFYKKHGIMPPGSLLVKEGEWKEVRKVSRKFADQVFRNELLKAEHKLAPVKAEVSYKGVRIGGRFGWPGN